MSKYSSFCLVVFAILALNVSSSFAQSASFTFQNAGSGSCAPSTVSFTQTSTGTPVGFSWTFGNGQTSNEANPVITFINPGSYDVKLVAIYDQQASEVTQTININPSIAVSLSADRNYICTAGNINFTATSTGNIATYEFNFGDGTPIVSTSSSSINHTFSTFGSYNVTVKATDVSGCSASNSASIILQNPPLSGTVSPINGCINATANFTATATLPVGANITNYAYNFNDGSPVLNSPNSNVQYTYSTVGVFNPTVTITTNEGCTNTFSYPPLRYGTPPVNLVAFPDKMVYCGSETPTFSASADNANSYLWDYGDGTTETVMNNITTHKYGGLGIKDVTVTPFFNGCPGASTMFSIEIVGVISSFNYANTCNAKNTFSFTNTSEGNISSLEWSFGDGTATTTMPNPVHTFPITGTHNTTLSVTDNITGCSDALTIPIYTATPTLTNPQTFVCRNSNTTYTINNNYDNPALSYNWNTVGLLSGPNASNPFEINASIFGSFNENFVSIMNGSQYCNDTIRLGNAMTVRGPMLSFIAADTICAKSDLVLQNMSTSFFPEDVIASTFWNYGISPTNDTIFQPNPVTYNNPGNYNIKLDITDNKGCRDSLFKPLNVKPIPFLRILPRQDTVCAGNSLQLIAYHSDPITWSPANLVSCATCDTVMVSPTTSTKFFVTAINNLNCPVTDSSFVRVFEPFTASSGANPFTVCANDSVRLNVTPPEKVVTWSPVTSLSNPNIYDPIASPDSSTTYTANLIDSAGCFSSIATVRVIVKTRPIVDAGPDKIVPYNSSFTITPTYSPGVSTYLWTPADSLSCSNCPSPSGIALKKQEYIITATSDSGCVSKDSIVVFVECNAANIFMPSAFTPNNDGNNDRYYPLTRGINKIKKFTIFNRFGQVVFNMENVNANDRSTGWNGKFKNVDQTREAYVYVLEATCDRGEVLFRKGSFLLLR